MLEAYVHPTAIIGDGAKIHETAKIGPYAVIGGNVTIGAGTRVGAHAVIDGHTTIGDNCNIFPSASVGLEPQDLSYKGEATGVIIGNRTTLREFATVHRGTGDRFTVIGDDCFFMNYSHVAHDCRMGNGVILANGATFGGHCQVGDYVVCGGLVVFHQHVRVGRMVMISGAMGTRADMPPFSLCDGRPARVVGVNAVGMRRQKFSVPTRTAIKNAYKLIYRSGLNTANALSKIESELPDLPELREIVEFYRSSKRGVIKGGFDDENGDEGGEG
jgi:UDP-N-acetylglucosamine acyltransferase